MGRRKQPDVQAATRSEKKDQVVTMFRSKSLSYKISVVTALMLAIFLTLLIAVSATIAARSLNKAINGEFEGIAAENGKVVQSIITSASNAADIINDYLVDQYQERDAVGYNGITEKSAVYDVNLQQQNKIIEEFLISVSTSTAENTEGIVGMGVFFEPYTFDPAIQDYTIYVSEEDAKAGNGNVKSYGEYASYSTGAYYVKAAETRENCFTDPYEDQGVKMFSASFPIIYKEKLKGVVVVDISIDTLGNFLTTTSEKYTTMYADVFNPQGMFIYDSESDEYVGRLLKEIVSEDDYVGIKEGVATGESFHVKTRKDGGGTVIRYYVPLQAAGETWWASSALYSSDLNKNTVQLVIIMVVLALVTLAVIIVLSGRLLRRYINPIHNVMKVADELAQGNFNVSLEAEYDDEIGALAKTFSKMAATLRAIIFDFSRSLQEMARGNFNISPTVENVGDFKEMEGALNKVIRDMSDTLHEINDASEAVASNSGQIASGAQALTDGATDQASSVDELQSTIGHVSEQVVQNAENANAANEMAKNVGSDIMRSNEQMKKVVAAMETINETSQQVSNIISTIDDIAEQTNLLALNASIEAARAGEAGRGFAVVATQVGTLAAQSAEAAKNSSALIIESMRAVDEGKQLVDETAQMLVDSVAQTNELVDNIAEITVASDQQSAALAQIAEAATQIAAVIEENTAMAEESSASSEELAAQADKLKALTGQFTLLER